MPLGEACDSYRVWLCVRRRSCSAHECKAERRRNPGSGEWTRDGRASTSWRWCPGPLPPPSPRLRWAGALLRRKAASTSAASRPRCLRSYGGQVVGHPSPTRGRGEGGARVLEARPSIHPPSRRSLALPLPRPSAIQWTTRILWQSAATEGTQADGVVALCHRWCGPSRNPGGPKGRPYDDGLCACVRPGPSAIAYQPGPSGLIFGPSGPGNRPGLLRDARSGHP